MNKIKASYPYRILFQSRGDRVRVVPVNYLKLNPENSLITSVYGNFAVRGTNTMPDERQRLTEVIAQMAVSLKLSEKALPSKLKLSKATHGILGIEFADFNN